MQLGTLPRIAGGLSHAASPQIQHLHYLGPECRSGHSPQNPPITLQLPKLPVGAGHH
jgi:hypothetical protein